MMPNMTQNRLAAITFRWSIATVFALWVFASSAPAQRVRAGSNPELEGVYNGSFTGEQGPTKFKLTITRRDNNGYHIGGVLTFDLPEGSGTKAYTCDLEGTYISRGGFVGLRRTKWETAPPSGLDMAGIDAAFNSGGGNGAGRISGRIGGDPAYKFEAIRDAAESAKMAGATTKPAEPPAATPVARPARQSTAANGAAPSPASRAPSGPAINGVYTGTYGSNPDDNVTAKLYVKFINDGYGGGQGALTGLFTFDVPPSLGAKPVTYTYKLSGRTNGIGGLDFSSAQPLGKPAPDAYAMKSLFLSFAQDPWPNINPDKITSVISYNPPRNKFEATRDKDESAKLDSLMAAQASAAGPAVSAAAPAGTPIVRPGIEGVFNGTYTRAKGPPTKFKLTMTHTRYDGAVTGVMGLAGMATIYLPIDSGTKAYTFSLTGIDEGHGNFFLHVHDWETMPPKDFENLKSMGFSGTFRSNMNQNTARIISEQGPGFDAHDFVPKFEATWDATESADIKGTIAAQKAVDAADYAAALKAHAEVMKNAQPKELASKDVVRKSQAYWNGYQGDFIRQIFDGGFADDVNDDLRFREMFTTYVDLFSEKYSADLPANHHPIKIVTTTYLNGSVVKTESKTVDIDPRFIPKYCEFTGVEPDPGSPQASEAAAKDIQIMRRVLKAGTAAGRESNGDAFARIRVAFAHPGDVPRDMNKFFATETGKSAAMRQLTENLLRGATGEPSLQEAGAKVEGAQTETDKDFPPGRFTHLIDAANAFCRDPANARYRSQYETTFYMLLAEKYQRLMTPEEEYYYANDFAVRFRGQIEGTRANSTDPAWVRLHPAVEECLKELGR
jgi:hypothetical protein